MDVANVEAAVNERNVGRGRGDTFGKLNGGSKLPDVDWHGAVALG